MGSFHTAIQRAAGLAALGLLGTAFCCMVRLQRADWLFIKGDTASLRQAVQLAPDTAEYSSGLAQAEPNRAVDILEHAIALNSFNASLQLELGLAREQQGDFAGAEASLLRSVRLDTGFGPRWALSDFYFHRRDANRFWPAVKDALTVSYGDVSAEFRNCWALSDDPRIILDRGIPNRPPILRSYLDFLLSEGRLDAAKPVADRILAHADRESTTSLLNYCDRMLAAGSLDAALDAWNGLARRKLIPYPELGANGELLVNGDFRNPVLGHGFDWQLSIPEGIYREEPGLTLHFSGRQPENVSIASQYVPLLPHRRYILTIRYRTVGLGPESGLTCTLASACARLAGSKSDLTQSVVFEAPDDRSLGRLTLSYRRSPGTLRIEGSLTVERISLALVREIAR